MVNSPKHTIHLQIVSIDNRAASQIWAFHPVYKKLKVHVSMRIEKVNDFQQKSPINTPAKFD